MFEYRRSCAFTGHAPGLIAGEGKKQRWYSTSLNSSVAWLGANVAYSGDTGRTGYEQSAMVTMNAPATVPVFLTSTKAFGVLVNVTVELQPALAALHSSAASICKQTVLSETANSCWLCVAIFLELCWRATS